MARRDIAGHIKATVEVCVEAFQGLQELAGPKTVPESTLVRIRENGNLEALERLVDERYLESVSLPERQVLFQLKQHIRLAITFARFLHL